MTGSGERLNNHPTTLVVFNVSANLAGQFWVTETVNVVILYNTHMPMCTVPQKQQDLSEMFCAVHICQMPFPGISKAYGYAPATKSIVAERVSNAALHNFFSVHNFSNISGVEPVTPLNTVLH